MAGVDFSDDERDVGLHAIVAGIGDDDVTGLGKFAFNFGSDGGVHSREDETGRTGRLRFGDNDFGGFGRDIAIETPGCSVFELLTGGAITGSEPSQSEPGMALQEADEVLAHHAGAAKDAYFDGVHNFLHATERDNLSTSCL